ncbi:M28 family peptidase [Longimicrobium terrae]|uniref:Zn-dependent M28 family amino/carboxypeptidase n=1 Tax=Longimicrobium terrae TaxID=1639882 RepID=A0A841H073_9BACT|nr:M28 family peptidase [Longimicrobium terrae]MBB4637024.1 Zn-dependent M28 family amino/carboxypeptidase [Longimicrobium terrae]MBB6071368.1 Zn-dependent M28 family amino/carboxypeptidase [Longimicrobium terrae]NNC31413.1 M28 family peptidase [Longimicrobium terrae]
MNRRIVLAAAGGLLAATTAAAQTPRIRASEIDGHLRFLSSDLLEGRAPATRGGRLATEYIASQLRAAGVEPGVNGGYFQQVPIDIVGADPASIRVQTGGRSAGTLRYPEDVVVWAGSASEASAANAEIVFVGYGSKAPEYRWDDFKGMDLRGKVLMVLVNDAPASAAEPDLFGGRAMTYYGRWTYKFEEAERQGAAGMLIVHTSEQAGYPWHTVVGSWAKEQRMLPRDANLPAPLGFRGWITDSAATAVLRGAGMDLADLRRRAESRDFRPVATGVTLNVGFRNTVQHLQSENVVGVVRGSDRALADQYVSYSAHWDHLGIGPAVRGDSIYNGASDNASGVADLLAIARAAAQGPRTKRSQLFVFVTAEESGLLGSEFFARNPTVPVASIVANLNVDGGNVLGTTTNFSVLGENKSTLGASLAGMVRGRGWRLTPDDHPERGHFYRSDHFSFAKAGVPAVSIGAGNAFEGRPAGWGAEQEEDYNAHRYHQPSDEYRADWDLRGAVQLSELVLDFGAMLANAATLPDWSRDAEFRRPAASRE